jgi:hypothetical protein
VIDRAHVVRIVASFDAGNRVGTGFVVGRRWLVTALHVLADRTIEPPRFATAATLQFSGIPAMRLEDIRTAAADRFEDWVVVSLPAEVPIDGLDLAPLGERRGTVAWEGFGFPEGRAQDGRACGGVVRSVKATLGTTKVLQLFSQEAAAALGERVQGYSRSPVVVEGKVLGIVRAADRDARGASEAGTLYACPVQRLRADGDVLAAPETAWNLPPLPEALRFPPNPFVGTGRFTEHEARAFFGRNRDIRRLRSTRCARH